MLKETLVSIYTSTRRRYYLDQHGQIVLEPVEISDRNSSCSGWGILWFTSLSAGECRDSRPCNKPRPLAPSPSPFKSTKCVYPVIVLRSIAAVVVAASLSNPPRVEEICSMFWLMRRWSCSSRNKRVACLFHCVWGTRKASRCFADQ
jgi:hypothetical protein